MNNLENKIVVHTGSTIPVEYQNNIDALISLYDKRKEIMVKNTQEIYLPERTIQLEEWFEEELAKIKRDFIPLENSAILSTDESNIIEVGVSTDNRNLDISTVSNVSMDELTEKVVEKFTDECVPSFSLEKHYDYTIDFSKNVGYVAGTFLTSHLLASIGLPPTALLKPLIIGGVKIGWFATSSIVNYCAANPAVTTAVVGTNLPIIYNYVEKGIKKLNTKQEDPVTVDTKTDPSIVQVPSVDQPIVESHSLYEFFQLIGSITWKVLKKIQDLL